MKILIKVLIIISVFTSCINEEVPKVASCENFDASILDADLADFFDIVFGSEFGVPVDRVRKWDSEVKIFVPVRTNEALVSELQEVIDELNSYSESFFLSISPKQNESNLIFFFGSGEDYVQNYNPSASDLIKTNRGLFSIEYEVNSFKIINATCWINTEADLSTNCYKHLIREELTQALGMINDIDTNDESIFLQRYTCTPDFSERDIEFIRFFLSDKIKPGLCKDQVYNVLKI